MANVPARTDEASVLIRSLSHTVRPTGDTDHGTKFETGAAIAKQKRVRSSETIGGGRRTKESGSKIRDVASCVALGMGDNLTKFEESWKTWELQVDVYENLTKSKLDERGVTRSTTKTPRQTVGELPTVRE